MQSCTVKIKLIDVGRTISCNSAELIYLIDKFRTLPAQAVDIQIDGIVPNDCETDFDSSAVTNVRHWLEKNVTEKVHIEAKVKLTVMNTIFVENIRLVRHLAYTDTDINYLSIKRNLIDKNFCIKSALAFPLLQNMAKDAGKYLKGVLNFF